MRSTKEILGSSREFAHEERGRSWRNLATTVCVFVGLLAIVISPLHWVVRVPASVLLGLTLLRWFVIYHDYQHGTILQGSRLATGLMWLYGLSALTPPSVWKRSHDHHHKNNAKTFGANIGSFPVMLADTYRHASRGERAMYVLSRHPLTIALGYFSVFFVGMCVRPFLTNRHLDCAVSVVVHFAIAGVLLAFGIDVLLLALVVPMTIGAGLGAYLFYAQHNYPGVELPARANWDFVFAALRSSSFIRMSRVMHWFTGNIGYHHVHHLNFRIPFYRLPEAMAAIEELQSPVETSLLPRDMIACLRLDVWDPVRNRLLTFREAREPLATSTESSAALLAE
jgi:omega-6 fatty acid desaturase (delta-12 desaturase)